jgi:hypothetical protein
VSVPRRATLLQRVLARLRITAGEDEGPFHYHYSEVTDILAVPVDGTGSTYPGHRAQFGFCHQALR